MQVAEYLRLLHTTFIWTDAVLPVMTAFAVILIRYACKLIP
jgi:hypothetical protein